MIKPTYKVSSPDPKDNTPQGLHEKKMFIKILDGKIAELEKEIELGITSENESDTIEELTVEEIKN